MLYRDDACFFFLYFTVGFLVLPVTGVGWRCKKGCLDEVSRRRVDERVQEEAVVEQQ